jgi:ABC-type antimicrobial peptide transport system permease subunit
LKQAANPEVYAEYFQHAEAALDVSLVVRGPASLQPAIERIVTSLNRNTAVDFESLDSVLSGTIIRERFQTALLAMFAGCALLLAVVGVYGLLSYVVTRRSGEISVRMALGANRRSIVQLVLSQGGMLVLTGATIGLAGSLFATRALEAMLYEVKANDGSVLFAVAGGFAAVALLVCCLPAQRAARISPSEALRAE